MRCNLSAAAECGSGDATCHDYVLSRGFHVRASFLPVETHCEDGGWIQLGLNLFTSNKAFSSLNLFFHTCSAMPMHTVHEPFLLIRACQTFFSINNDRP